uniref:Claudin n=1 Tax=Oncorhynchus mykiss TaxID=8022 RepID=A0A8C7TB48_ONCMY
MSTAVELTGFLLCVASCLLTGSSLANDYWKMSSVSVSVIVSTRQFQNLFHSCAENSAGIRNWKDFESMLALPDYIQACRALMIIALLLGLASIIVSVRGLKCTEIGSTSEQVKGEITLSCGSLFILSGLSTLTAVSWYAARVVQEFHDPFLAGVRFELGTGLYRSAILGGVMLCCSCKRGPSAPPTGGYSYNYSKTSRGQQIYRAAPVSVGEFKKKILLFVCLFPFITSVKCNFTGLHLLLYLCCFVVVVFLSCVSHCEY